MVFWCCQLLPAVFINLLFILKTGDMLHSVTTQTPVLLSLHCKVKLSP
jgi:hypothetical protein